MINYITFLGNLMLYECTKYKLLYMNVTYFIYRFIKYQLFAIAIHSSDTWKSRVFHFYLNYKSVINIYTDNFENQFVIIMVVQPFISSIFSNELWNINFTENRNNRIFSRNIVISLYRNASSLIISNNFLRLSHRYRLRHGKDDAATQSPFLLTTFRWAEKSMIQIEITNESRRGSLGRSIRA